jgi:leader peptidase (prepilin peptidase)/N-methyltransferase
MPFLHSAMAFALGAIVGSFVNVVIHRWPREESVVFPPSRCPACGSRIRPYDNVPILAYLWLLGRCRSCRSPISGRYPVVELTNALFFSAIFLRTGFVPLFFVMAAMVSMTLALIYIDLDVQLLPDAVTYPGIAIGIAAGWMNGGALAGDLRLAASLPDSAMGAVIGGGSVALMIGIYWLLRGVQGMGWGDVKMMAMIGAFTGWEAAIFTLLLGAVMGTVIGVPIALRRKERLQYALPFGVFLGIAFLLVVFFGDSLVWLAPLLLTDNGIDG